MSSPWSRGAPCQLVFQTALPDRCPGCGADVAAPQATPESVSYYAVRDRKKVGPLTLAQMRDLASAGRLGPDDMVLPHGGRTWLPARQVGGLFPETAMPETVDQAAPTAPHQPSSSLAVAGAAGRPGAPVVPGYEIEGELGRGGMGVVYRARQVALKRPGARKMILSGGHAGPQELARFRSEAESVARLTHPNIVQVYETGQHNGLPYFSLEFVDGGTLAKRLAGTPQPPRSAAGLLTLLA